jgi:hypothetical protein
MRLTADRAGRKKTRMERVFGLLGGFVGVSRVCALSRSNEPGLRALI